MITLIPFIQFFYHNYFFITTALLYKKHDLEHGVLQIYEQQN
jgi:hypothetical protein